MGYNGLLIGSLHIPIPERYHAAESRPFNKLGRALLDRRARGKGIWTLERRHCITESTLPNHCNNSASFQLGTLDPKKRAHHIAGLMTEPILAERHKHRPADVKVPRRKNFNPEKVPT
jgi:hypothetical protein